MQLKIGDKVSFLHEVGSGIVLKINNKTVILEDENGFEMEYPINLLVPSMRVSEDVLFSEIESQSKVNLVVKKPLFTPKKNGEPEWKIDLHIENLIDSHSNMSNFEILTIQLEHFKKFLKTAETARVGRMVIVHGVGKGKLKSEILEIVKNMNGAEIFDADYYEYGRGASIVERKYNIR